MQLKYGQGREFAEPKPSCGEETHLNSIDGSGSREFQLDEFQNLGSAFEELGLCMMELGLCLARVCDRVIGGQELEQSLLESCAAKGRLIHYHSVLDSFILKEHGRRKGCAVKQIDNKMKREQRLLKQSNFGTEENEAMSCGIHSNLWQQWHYDYGIFTVLTDPMFLLPSTAGGASNDEFSALSAQDVASPCGYSFLQIYHPNKNKVLMVKTSPESFIVQVGESADILTKGKLRSTLHCVRRPPKLDYLSRETFVVFLQPSWSKTFVVSDYLLDHYKLKCPHLDESNKNGSTAAAEGPNALSREIQNIVPPLSARLKDGMTFAEFSRETTKQYYGGSGLQSNR